MKKKDKPGKKKPLLPVEEQGIKIKVYKKPNRSLKYRNKQWLEDIYEEKDDFVSDEEE